MSDTRLPPFTPGQERFGLAAVKLMNRVNRWIHRLTGGRVFNRFLRGAPICLLTVRGRRTGEPRTAALLYLAAVRAMTARRVSDEEKAALWPRLTAMYRDYDDYQGRTTGNIPVIRLSPRP